MTRKDAAPQAEGSAGVSGFAHPGPVSESWVISTVRRHPTEAFFCLAFSFSWGYWIPVALTGGRLSHFPGLLGPMLAAFVVTTLTKGGAGMKELWARMICWRVA
ncbi:MAG: hypothetical protein M3P01_10455, partial [Actinomycetota bacterium]|nr:hypothetical protein [Actinomycetota bacterium]